MGYVKLTWLGGTEEKQEAGYYLRLYKVWKLSEVIKHGILKYKHM